MYNVVQDGKGKQKSSVSQDQTESPGLAYSIYICKPYYPVFILGYIPSKP